MLAPARLLLFRRLLYSRSQTSRCSLRADLSAVYRGFSGSLYWPPSHPRGNDGGLDPATLARRIRLFLIHTGRSLVRDRAAPRQTLRRL